MCKIMYLTSLPLQDDSNNPGSILTLKHTQNSVYHLFNEYHQSSYIEYDRAPPKLVLKKLHNVTELDTKEFGFFFPIFLKYIKFSRVAHLTDSKRLCCMQQYRL